MRISDWSSDVCSSDLWGWVSSQVQLLAQQPAQIDEHPADAGVVELAGDRRVDGDVFIGGLERDAVALPLLADVAQGVFRAALVVLVEHDQFGEVEHVELLEIGKASCREKMCQ